MKSSTKDNAEGKMHQVKGKIKETVGKVVGNRRLGSRGQSRKSGRESSRKARPGRESCGQVEGFFLKTSYDDNAMRSENR